MNYNPTYPKEPSTLGQYIRKFRKDKGLTIGGLAREIGVHKFTLYNWEIRGKFPRIRELRERLVHEVEGAGKFLPS